MSATRAALVRVLVVALLTVIALIVTAPSDEPSPVTTAVAPDSEPIIAHLEAP